MKTANYWIKELNLEKHPEGGFYKETYRSAEGMRKEFLPDRYIDSRPFATSIYFMLQKNDFSSFHKLKSDETWHFYQGKTLELYVMEHNGNLKNYLLGPDYEAGEQLQITIPQDNWFAAKLQDCKSYALVGCTMAPGFHFDDFELADRSKLIQQYPQHEKIIKKLTFN